jgi:1,4-alpha-glucan branching enzyme
MHNARVLHDVSLFTDYDIYLFKQGSHLSLYEKLGAHFMEASGRQGTYFAVWAPNVEKVSVMGDFNGWDRGSHSLGARWDGSGIWEGFIPGVRYGALYKYHIVSKQNDFQTDKGDPYAFYWEVPPKTGSVIWDLSYKWNDAGWMKNRHRHNALDAPVSIYEVHPGSWMRVLEEGNRYLTYRELAHRLAEYVKEMGFTHVEFMPVMEHPFYGSWGYQCTGYFAPTSRYGTPQDFMYLVDHLHQNDIGVILDWVPSHFPDDNHGLAYFDGTYLYEHADPKKGYHPVWKSYIFNYGRNEVRNFLLSSVMFWMEKYHIDGLRVDAVASMLYLDYGRKQGEWIPNEYGGHENLDAIGFLRRLNEIVYEKYPDVQTIAEESTAWPMVSKPTYLGGLGFGMKWNMGWMHDTLHYFSQDPVLRKYHHNQLIFSIIYAFHENFVLSLSHDEVVYGKGSLIEKMPGDDWQKFANLRLLYGYMYCHPGKKLLFMGGEFGQRQEWYHEEGLHWDLLEHAPHQGLKRWVKDLNVFLKREPALYERDFEHEGFEWDNISDWEKSVISFLRRGRNSEDTLLVVCNHTPVLRDNYRIGVPREGFWKEVLNSDSWSYGGSDKGNYGGIEASPVPSHGKYYSLSVTLPPLGIVVFKISPDNKK